MEKFRLKVVTNFRRTIEMPKNWEIFSLDEVKANQHNSFVDGPFGSCLKTSDYTTSGIPVIQLNNLGIGKFIPNKMNFTSEIKFKELNRANAFPGDIIIAKMAEPVARCCILPELYEKYMISADCIKLKVDEEKFSSKFISHMINSSQVMSLTLAFATGTTRLRINLTDLKKVRIICPIKKSEQDKIASVLSNLDELIQKQEQIIEKYNMLMKGQLKKLFTQGISDVATQMIQGKPRYIKYKIPKEWKLESFEKHYSFVKGKLPKEQFDNMKMGRLDYLTSDNLSKKSQKYIHKSDGVFVDKSDVIMIGDGDGSGRVYTSKKGILASTFILFKKKQTTLDNLFTFYYLQYFYSLFYNTRYGTGIPHVDKYVLENLQIPILPDILQQKITTMIANLDSLIQQEKQYKEKLEKIKRGLMQQLLTGEKRVIV
jgi:type I restriction enzyme, S subunit